MANFSTNQVRHLYVAKVSGTAATGTVGTLEVGADTAKEHLYFKYMGPGGQVRSPLINISQISKAVATDADSMAHALKKYKVSLDASVNSGNPIVGQDYVLRIAFRNYIGLSEEDQYFKYGIVHGVTGMTPEVFYQTMKTSLEKNFSRELNNLLNFSLTGTYATVTMTTNTGLVATAVNVGTAANSYKLAIGSITASTEAVTIASGTVTVSLTAAAKTYGDVIRLIAADPVASTMFAVTGTAATTAAVEVARTLTGGTTTGLAIEEGILDWKLGTMPVAYVNFKLMPTTVYNGTEDVIWGTVTELSPASYITNGKMSADLEYFCMGERGDIYRNVGFPRVIPTTYIVDSTKKYNMIDITYAYQGNGEDVQKSQQTVTLLVPKVGATNATSNVLANTIIGAINTAAGASIALLDV